MLSAAALGSRYEACCVTSLARILVMLRRRGGPGDGGVDLIGRYLASGGDGGTANTNPPLSVEQHLHIIAQCKAEAGKLGPAYVRELEGVMNRRRTLAEPTRAVGLAFADPYTSNARGGDAHLERGTLLGLLISASGFSVPAIR